MGCGLATRYMRDQRRQRLASASDPLVRTQSLRSGKPALWDVWAVPGYGKWEDMMVSIHPINKDPPRHDMCRIQPLSVELRRTSTTPPVNASLDRRELSYAEQFLELYQGLGRGVLCFPSPLRRTSSRNDVPSASQAPSSTKVEEPADLQIVVLVAMPSTTSRIRKHTCAINGKDTHFNGEEHSQDKSSMSDVAVGVTAIPWDKERVDFG
jgi:hypothetical protein